MSLDALALADEVVARIGHEPLLLGPWRVTKLALASDLEICLAHPDGTTQRISLQRPGGPARQHFGDFDATLHSASVRPDGDTLLRALLDPWATARVSWPVWTPDVVPLVVTGGIPRAGSQWCTRIVRTLVSCGGRAPSSRRGPEPDAILQDGFDEIERALVEQRKSPTLRMEKAPYWPGSPDPDAPVRHFFARRDVLDVLWSQLRQLEGQQALSRTVAFRMLLDASIPRLMRALEDAPAGPTTRIVRYERLSNETEQEIGAMTDFLGIELPHTWIARIARQHSFEDESGDVRGRDRVGSYHRSGTIGDGRRGFEPSEIAAIEQITGGLQGP